MRKIFKTFLLGILFLVTVTAIGLYMLSSRSLPNPPQPNDPVSRIAINNVNIVDIEFDSIYSQSILIENGKIIWIGNVDSRKWPKETKVISGKGKYAIPGLWDMHTHVDSELAPHFSFPLYIANGVLNIRDLGGHAPYFLKKQWQSQVKSNELLGPNLVSIAASNLYRAKSEEHVKELVDQFPGDSTDFIKILNAVLPEHFTILMEEAKKKSIPILGHKPRSVSAVDAVRLGFKSMEHARLFLFECYPGAEQLRNDYYKKYTGELEGGIMLDDSKALQIMLDDHSDLMFQELVNEMISQETWFCPTHITRKMDAFADNDIYRNDPRLAYINRIARWEWNGDAEQMIKNDPTPEGRKTYMDFYLKGLELTGKAHDMGLRILAGSDANDTYSIPGFSIHDELQELVKAGLSPAEALAAATILPAVYSNISEQYGSIETGKYGDIILLDENPLEDISNTKKINMVLHQGQIYARSDLDYLLEHVKSMASNWTVNAHLFWLER